MRKMRTKRKTDIPPIRSQCKRHSGYSDEAHRRIMDLAGGSPVGNYIPRQRVHEFAAVGIAQLFTSGLVTQ